MSNENPYDALIQSDLAADGEREARFKASALLSLDANPDQVAKVRRDAAYLGVPPAAAAEAIPEDIRRRAAVQQIEEHTREAPTLRRRYTEQDFARLAHDDSFNLSQIEKGVRTFINGGAFKDAPGKVGSALAEGGKQILLGATVGLGAGIFDAAAVPLDIGSALTRWALPQDVLGMIAADYRGRAQAARSAMDWASSKPEGNLEKGVQSGLRSSGQNLALLPLGAARGATAMVSAMASAVGATAYTEARERGLDPVAATTYALPHGVFEYAFEKLPALYLLDDMAKHSGLAQLVKHQVMSEVPGEQATTSLQDFNDWARLNPEKSARQFIEERPDAAVQTVIATLVGVGVQGGAVRGTQKLLGGLAEREARQREAEGTAAVLSEMFELAAGNKLRERDAASFAEFVQTAVQEHAGEERAEVFVDGAVLAQSLEAAGLTAEQFAQVAPAAAAQLQEAASTGGDVAIPLGELVGKMAGTGLEQTLLEHLRASPEALSQAEAKEAAGKAQEFFQQQAQALLADAQQGEALRASGEAVRAKLVEQLAGANRFTADVNAAYASLVRDFYLVTSQRLGVTPEALYQRYPLRVAAERIAGEAIDQGVASTPEFRKWFAASAAVDAAGKPLMLYHGTASDFTAFEAAKGTSEGFHFHADPKQASLFALARSDGGKGANVLPVYLSLQNPKRVKVISNAEVDQAKDEGYDGLIAGDHYVAFSPNQIKSVFNDGEFNPVDPDILHQGPRGGPKIEPTTGLPTPETSGLPAERLPKYRVSFGEARRILAAAEQMSGAPGVASKYRDMAAGFIETAQALLEAYAPGTLFKATGEIRARPTGQPVGGFYAVDAQDRLLVKKGYQYGDMPPRFATEEAAIKAGAKLFVQPQGRPGEFSQGPRGTYNPQALTISLLANADLSTFLHETGHFFLDALGDMAAQPGAPAEIQQDMAALLAWFGIDKGDEAVTLRKDDIRQGEQLAGMAERFKMSPRELVASWRKKPPVRGEQGALWKELNGIPELALFAAENPGKHTMPSAGQQRTPLEIWRAMTVDQQRPFHEKFAQSFEQYLFEGKAPNTELSGLFGRFRAWLTSVYQSLSAFVQGRSDLQLSDEVRRVMDRLIATDEQIAQAEAARGYLPAFDSAQAAGMTEAQWASYQTLGAKATAEAAGQLQRRSLRDMRWLTGARGRALAALQKEAAAKRKAVEAEVRAEVDNEPVYRAQAYIAELTAPSEGDKQAVKEWKDRRAAQEERVAEAVKAQLLASPEAQGLKGLAKGQFIVKNKRASVNEVQRQMIEWDAQNPKPRRALAPLEADVIAERFGFRSGDEMLRAMADAWPKATVMEGITDQRMLERYGDLASKEGLQRAADEAVHNEARGRFVATELAALQKGVGKVNVLIKAAKGFAERMVAAKRVRDLKPGQHAAAETRAARRAEQALKKGDNVAAATAKRDQLLQHYAARETSAAMSEVDRGVAYLRRLGEGPREKINADYVDQIDKLLERFDLRKSTSLTEIDKRASLREWLEAQAEIGIEPDLPEAVLQEAYSKSYKELTVEEFRGLVDAVRQLEHLGRLKDKLLTAKDQREFKAVRDLIVASIEQHAGAREADTRTPNTVSGGALVGLKNFWAAHIKAATWARVMDGGKDGGPVWEYIIRPANAAGDKEVTMRAKATQDLATLLKPVMAQGPLGGKGKYFPSIDRSLNREAVLAIALNTGNESNIQRLLGGENWNLAQLDPVLQSLTAADWHFVQAVWDYFESYRPEIAAKEKRVSGKEPEWLDPAPREMALADGSTVKLKGGYYPVKYDPRASERAEAFADAEAAKAQMKGAFTSATTRRSFTKTRAEEVKGRPLLYSLDGLYNGVNEVIHDLSWHEFLIDANRLVKNKAVAAVMREKYGPEAHQQFKSWLQDVAAGEVAAHNAGEKALAWVRQGVSISGLGFNVMSALIQPLGITQSIVRVGAKYVGKGVATYIASPLASADAVHEKSEFMRTRAMTRLRELAEVRAQVKGRSKARQAVDGSAYYLMLRAQQMVDIPTWLGAYEKAFAEGNDEDRARALADQAVIDSQGSGMLKDLSAIERGGPAQKLFTVFYSFFNTALNLGANQTMTAEGKAKLAADYLLLYMVPVVLGALLKSAVVPGDSGDDDPAKLAKRLIGEEISYLFGLMFGVREVSGAAQALTGTAQYGTDYSGPAGLRPITDLAKLAKQVNQGEADDALRKAIINTAGELLRLPAAQINRSITGAKALAEGKTENPMALVLGYQEPH